MNTMPGYNGGYTGYPAVPITAQPSGMPSNSSTNLQNLFRQNATLSVINEFKSQQARAVRQSTIILSAFNGAAGLAVALGIIVHCYMSVRRRREAINPKNALLNCICGPELYPFMLSIGIIIQAIMFGTAQGQGLSGVYLAESCPEISGVVWLAWFIVPYIQLVLGIESALRAIRSSNFSAKGSYTAVKCLAIILVLLLSTGSVAIVIPAQPICFASLPWFVSRWAIGAFIILIIITVVLAVSAVILFRQLSTHLLIENDQRIEGSRMVYFLAIGSLTNAFSIPFFFHLTFGSAAQTEPSNTLAMIVMVVVNLTGIVNGALYLFLRRGSLATISPKGHRFVDIDDQIYKVQARSPQAVNFNDHMKQPIPGFANMKWLESSETVDSMDKRPMAVGGAQSYGFGTAIASPSVPPKTPNSIQQTPSRFVASNTQEQPAAFSLPAKRIESTQSYGLLPSTTYNPNQEQAIVSPVTPGFDFLQPPPSAFGHRRGSSLASSATVQIGLRISNVGDMQRVMANRQTQGSTTSSFLAPPALPTLPSSTFVRPSPLAISQQADSTRFSNANTDKVLPPVPIISSTPKPPSPTKTPSPRGVGFNLPHRGPSPFEKAALPAPLRVRGGSDPKPPTDTWI